MLWFSRMAELMAYQNQANFLSSCTTEISGNDVTKVILLATNYIYINFIDVQAHNFISTVFYPHIMARNWLSDIGIF